MKMLASCFMKRFTLLMLIAIPQCTAQRRSRRCREPTNRKMNIEDRLRDSFYQVPPLLHTVANLSTIPEQFVRIRHTIFAGEPQCPTWEEAVRHHEGRVCPFHYVLNYDENRKPDTMVETQCNCGECLRPDNGPSNLMDCQPIIYYTKVFRRTACVEGVYRYAAIWEPLNIGCQCAHAPSRFTDNSLARSLP
ncbi:uncharacterized protein LOC124115965 [Haliotis rufescens]|uniref:uncharacterized protein LOC124115965 n=1 Tax=Haliotis rufescens TaxID=6454 RepID=UPI001EAF8FF4|nr:uncharacterized protein LOC124115965 [Haliotis rufescens]